MQSHFQILKLKYRSLIEHLKKLCLFFLLLLDDIEASLFPCTFSQFDWATSNVSTYNINERRFRMLTIAKCNVILRELMFWAKNINFYMNKKFACQSQGLLCWYDVTHSDWSNWKTICIDKTLQCIFNSTLIKNAAVSWSRFAIELWTKYEKKHLQKKPSDVFFLTFLYTHCYPISSFQMKWIICD